MKPALIIGSTCLDVIINIEKLPKTAENLRPASQKTALGGCAYNVASIMKLMGAPFTFLSPVGGGIFGDQVKKLLTDKGFSIPIYLPDRENGCCYCLVEASGERTFLSYHGVEYSFQKKWMDAYCPSDYSIAYVCGLEIEEETGIELVEYLETHRELPVCFAPGPRGVKIQSGKLERIMKLGPMLHLNEKEAWELSGFNNTKEAAAALQKKTGNTVIITLGEKGAYYLDKSGGSCFISSQPVPVVDTIGAGDSHIGAILSCLVLDKPLKEAVSAANRVSAAVVGVAGASLTQAQLHKALM